MSTTHLHSNILWLKVLASLREVSLIIPIVVAYYATKGVSTADFFLIQALFRVSIIVLETPLALLADRTDRRTMIIGGTIIGTFSYLMLWQAEGWWGVLAAEILMGASLAAKSAAMESLLFESLKSRGQEHQHFQILAYQREWSSYIGGVTILAGGWLYGLGTELPTLVTVAVCLLATVIAWQLVNVANGTTATEKPTSAEVFQTLRGNKVVVWLALSTGLISASTIVIFWSVQPILEAQISPLWMGVVVAAYFAARGQSARYAPRIVARLGTYRTYQLSLGLVMLGFVSVAFLPWVAPWWAVVPGYVLGSGSAFMLAETLGKDLLNHAVSSPMRTSAISAYQQVGRILGISSLGLTALLADVTTLPWALAGVGLVTTGLGGITLHRLKRHL